MRSFLGFVVFIAALIAVLAAFVVPALVAPLIASAVRDASPFGDQPLDVDVDVNALGLIRGFVSEIRISGTGLEADGARIGSLELAVQGVGINDQDFATVAGALDGVVVMRGGGATPVSVRGVTLSGSSTSVIATATVDPAQAVTLVRESLAGAGIDADLVELVDGGVAIEVQGQRVEVALVVLDGAVVAGPILGSSQSVIQPGAGDPWRITAIRVKSTGVEIDAAVDAGRLLRDD